ncbi:MAG: helix-turn-helix domain-containing protein [Acidobacteria bacterium]|nr:helix-turn-helix domain-containing protein [Acidobacteriota bacterium]
MTAQYDPKAYNKLLVSVSPGEIETENDYEQMLKMIDRLMKKDEDSLSPEEDRLIRLLAVLVEDYESRHYPIDTTSNPSVALRELMREHGLKQVDMVDIFGSQGTVSQVLNGKREISKAQARKLSARFHLPIDVFI